MDIKSVKGVTKTMKTYTKVVAKADPDWRKKAEAKKVGEYYYGSASLDDYCKTPKTYVKCSDTHPILNISMGGRVYVIQGGSCTSPVSVDYDVFIGLDSSMVKSKKSYPWEEGEHFLFPMPDMSVPVSITQFRNLIEYIVDSLTEGKSVFVGCIGGHGRTGLVLSALYSVMTGDKDAISFIRKNYCKKAVESAEQVAWLSKHFGITKVTPTKGNVSRETGISKYTGYDRKTGKGSSYCVGVSSMPEPEVSVLVDATGVVIVPTAGVKNIFGGDNKP